MRDTSTILIRTVATARRTTPGAAIAAVLLSMACGLGGCAGGGSTSGAFAMAPGGASGATVTFESIDGPPPQVFDRMVSVLDSESKLRDLAIISREGSASYRVRSYLSAQVNHGRTTIAWVWDVYDREQQRALRLSGEEVARKGGRDPWGAADDLVLRKIAQAGLSGLAAMVGGGTPSDGSPMPVQAKRDPAVASAEEPSPVRKITVSALGYTDR